MKEFILATLPYVIIGLSIVVICVNNNKIHLFLLLPFFVKQMLVVELSNIKSIINDESQ